MVGSSKILTVSYGTFSCTLEGFDDSFGTMKAIAEYFRDLATDDRYFGAEPPVPDAEMLARIASKEVSRRVEGRMEASGIVLRVGSALGPQSSDEVGGEMGEPVMRAAPPMAQAEPAMPPAILAPAGAARSEPTLPIASAQAVADRPAASERTASAGVATVGARQTVVPPYADDDVAAKLRRIRAVVGHAAAGSLVTVVPERQPIEVTPAPSGPEAIDASDDRARGVPDHLATSVSGAQAAAGHAPVAVVPRPMAVDDLADLALLDGGDPFGTVDEARPVATDLDGLGRAVDEGDAAVDALADRSGAGPGDLLRPRVIQLRTIDLEQAIAAGVLVEEAEAAGAAAPDVAGSGSLPANAPTEPELADAFTEASDEPVGGFDDVPGPGDATVLTGELSPEAEAELMAELTLVEAERDDLGPVPEEMARAEASEASEAVVPTMIEDAMLFEEAGVVEEPTEGPVDPGSTWAVGPTEVEDAAGEEATILAVAETQAEAHSKRAIGDLMTSLGLGSAPVANLTAADATPTAATTAAESAADDNLFAVDPRDIAEDEADLAWANAAEVGSSGPADEGVEEDADLAADLGPEPDAAVLASDGVDEGSEMPPEPVVMRHPVLVVGPDGDEAALTRILSVTDAQLAEPESSRRREAIAQLKAAVAATEAARRLGEAPADDGLDAVQRADPFRDDLRQVVRPRRTVAAGDSAHDERPRAAPLKLVASQRVDLPGQATEHAGTVQPIRPRRVHADAVPERRIGDIDAPASADHPPARVDSSVPAVGSFVMFAAEMGATSLTDILEAAAAYVAFVEGAEDFSRPQIMDKVREAGASDFSREDGLRSFGTLLRQGRIVRVRGGRFQVHGDSRFNPRRRAV